MKLAKIIYKNPSNLLKTFKSIKNEKRILSESKTGL
jgi:hypothetical protein